ncbi:MAG: GNAT family N-acyltransferase [Pseudomonadota bacterium]
MAATAALPAGGLDIRWADSEDEVREAQRLRYHVFVQELGARLPAPADAAPGHDTDRFDPFCDHLLVRATGPGDAGGGPLVGTYRVLAPRGARGAGGLYTDTEFDTRALAAIRPRAVELGRSCVRPGWRSGSVIMAMWSALCQYMLQHELDTMIGCASVGLHDGGATARGLWQRLRTTHLVDARWHVRPYRAYPLGDPTGPSSSPQGDQAESPTPPLIKGYLRCGARLLGPPAHDENFNTADLPMMLNIDDFSRRYRRHFLGR